MFSMKFLVTVGEIWQRYKEIKEEEFTRGKTESSRKMLRMLASRTEEGQLDLIHKWCVRDNIQMAYPVNGAIGVADEVYLTDMEDGSDGDVDVSGN